VSDPFPDRSLGHLDKIEWMVEQTGWALEAVPVHPETAEPPYAYTVGFETRFGFPEVVVFGLTAVAARGLLGLVAEFLAGGTEIPVGPVFAGLYDNGLRSALLPVDLDLEGHRFATCTDWHGAGAYRVVQLVWPDRAGWLPWESGFDERVSPAQPVIGSLAEVE
jgi:hypothetical protein